jgi:hypothetical protein
VAHPLQEFLKKQRLLTDAVVILTRKTGEGMAYEIDTIEKLGALSTVQKYTIVNTRSAIMGKIEDHFDLVEAEIEDAKPPMGELAAEIVTEYAVDAISEAVGPKSLLPAGKRLSAQTLGKIEQQMISGGRPLAIDAAMARIQGKSYRPLSTRVYRTQQLVKGQVNRMINQHLARGSSGRELARDIRQFVKPSAPGGLRGASLRLGRTELNNAFHAVSIDQAQKNPYVTGMVWHLSGSHPRPDACNDYEEQFFRPYEVPNKPHPNCFCYVTPETISSQGIRDQHLSGELISSDKVYEPLTRDQLSDPDTPRTRAVSTAEFNRLAAAGEKRLATFSAHASPPVGLDRHWNAVKEEAWTGVQKEWGGVTIDAHTGKNVTGEPNRYALTVRPPGVHSVTVPVGADRATFDTAMEDARRRFDPMLRNENYHLGVFRDDAISRIDIDPVLVLDKHADVESIGAYTHAEGGAYNFADGLGYWPPHVDKGLDHAGGKEGSTVQGLGRVVRTGNDSRGPP